MKMCTAFVLFWMKFSANPFAIRAALRILKVEYTTEIPTLAVTCEEQPRMLVNLAHEMGLFAHSGGKRDAAAPGDRRHLVLSRMVDELGRMIGGWLQKESGGNASAVGA